MRIGKRFLVLGLFSGVLLAVSYFLEYGLGQTPCSLCLLQRYALYPIVVGSLIAASTTHYQRLYTVFLALNMLLGASLAIRHLWIQSHPEETLSCTAGLEQLLETYPFIEALFMALKHSHDCAYVETFLSLPLSVWSLGGFLFMSIWLLFPRK